MDGETRWNFACTYYKRGNYQKAFESLSAIKEKSQFEGIAEVLLGLALQTNQVDYLVQNLIKELNPYLLALGYVLTYNADKKDQSKIYLHRLIDRLEFNFHPFPIDESLDKEEAKETLNFFVKSHLFEEGVKHFDSRIKKGQKEWYIYEALFDLMELSRKPEEVFNRCYSVFQKLMEIPGIKYKKNKIICYLLNFALKHQETSSIHIESIKLWKDYRDMLLSEKLLSEKDFAHFEHQFSKIPESTETRPPEEAWNRIKNLNYDLRNINNPIKVKNKKSKLYEYSDLIPHIYNNEVGQKVGSLMRQILDILCPFGEKPLNEETAKLINEADGLYQTLKDRLNDLGPTAKQDFLVVVRNLGICIAKAEEQLKVAPNLEVRILNQSLPPDMITTSLVVEAINDSENPIKKLSLDLEIDPDVFELQGNSRLEYKFIPPHESEVLTYSIKRIKESDTSRFRISCKFICRDKDYIKEPEEFTIPTKLFREIPSKRYIYDRDIHIDEPEKFHGREREIKELLQIFSPEGEGGFVFIDGVRKVGKTSLINFFTARLPDTIIPVVINLEDRDIRISTSLFLYDLCTDIAKKICKDNTATPSLPESEFEHAPVRAFNECISSFKDLYQNSRILLIIDEFQEMIKSIIEHKKGLSGLDEDPLNLMRSYIGGDFFDFIFTGSIRLSIMKEYTTHRIFASLKKRFPISFLDYAGVKATLQKPVETNGVSYPERVIERIWELVRGHPQLTQRIGGGCMNKLNLEKRYVVNLHDVEEVTKLLLTDQNFQHWWDTDYLEEPEEDVMRRFFKLQKDLKGVPINELASTFSSSSNAFITALNNLLEQQILTQIGNRYVIKGELLEQYIHLFLGSKVTGLDLNYCVIAFDHENFYLTLREEYWARILVSKFKTENEKVLSIEESRDMIRRFKDEDIRRDTHLGRIIKTIVEEEKVPDKVLEETIRKIVGDAKKYGEIVKSLAVACYQFKEYFNHQQRYWKIYDDMKMKIDTPRPIISEKNASDKVLRRELLRELLQDDLSRTRGIGTVILISGDGDFARPGALIDTLKENGRRILVRGFKSNSNPLLKEKVGDNFNYIDDIIDLDSLLKELRVL